MTTPEVDSVPASPEEQSSEPQHPARPDLDQAGSASSDESTAPSAAEVVGRRMREARLALGASQETLAELAGVHWTLIGQVERGQRNLTLNNFVRLAAALDVDPGSLVAGISAKQLPAKAPRVSKAEEIRRAREENRRAADD